MRRLAPHRYSGPYVPRECGSRRASLATDGPGMKRLRSPRSVNNWRWLSIGTMPPGSRVRHAVIRDRVAC